jgi:nucleoside-diphosphate-sugar epimerase
LGQTARCSHGTQIRDYLYVQDAADAIVALLESDVNGPVNIGSGYPTVLRDIIQGIGVKLQREDLIQLGAIPAREHDVSLVVSDTSRLANEVDWQPKYDLDKGLDQTIAWWRLYFDK